MFRKILTSAVFAGVATGVVAAILQFWLVTPLLLEGELYESGARVHFATDGSTQSEAGAPSLADEPARHLMSAGFNLVAFTGFALLLVTGFALAERRGASITPRGGLVWGLCGFLAVQLAPAVGLPPELPGTVGAEVELRQAWWLATIIASVAGLGLIAFGASALAVLSGFVILALPHLIGAPHLDTYFGVAPPELASLFSTRSLGASALAWTLLGYCAATFWSQQQET